MRCQLLLLATVKLHIAHFDSRLAHHSRVSTGNSLLGILRKVDIRGLLLDRVDDDTPSCKFNSPFLFLGDLFAVKHFELWQSLQDSEPVLWLPGQRCGQEAQLR